MNNLNQINDVSERAARFLRTLLITGKLAWEAPGVGKGGSVIFANGRLFLRHGTALLCYDLAAR